MKTFESNAVWVKNNTVKWSITSDALQNLVGAAKITIAETEKGSTDEFPLPPLNYGSFHYSFEAGKHYSIRLLLGEREYALATL